MAIDINAIRRRIEQLNGNAPREPSKLWKPQPGTYKVRLLPWPDVTDGLPFKERWFYYFVKPAILTPHQFGKPDPINSLLKKLWSSGKPEDREMAKKMNAKVRAFAPVIVRDTDNATPLIWGFSKTVHTKLLSYFEDGDVGDITDPNEGYDINVVITKGAAQEYGTTTVEAARKQSKLSNDPAQAKKWLESIPSLDEIFTLKTPQEIETALNNWLNAPEDTKEPNTSDTDEKTTQTRGVNADVLNDIVDDVKQTKAKGKSTDAPKRTLDDVFDELKSK